MEFDEKSVVPVLEAKYDSFTQSEKNIADFFMKNEEKMDFSAKEIAKHLFVSEASLSRFAKKCGFRGYREFIYQYEESFEEKNPFSPLLIFFAEMSISFPCDNEFILF